jgi:hypothetical protein
MVNLLATFDTAGVVSLLVGTVLPLLVGLLTKRSMNSGLKAAVLALLSALSAFLTQWLTALDNAQHFLWQAAVLSALATFAVAAGTHYQVWKPAGVASALADKGITDPAPAAAALDYGEVTPVATGDALYTGPAVVPDHAEANLAAPDTEARPPTSTG